MMPSVDNALSRLRAGTRGLLADYSRARMMRLLGTVDPALDVNAMVASVGWAQAVEMIDGWHTCLRALAGFGVLSPDRWRNYLRLRGLFRARDWLRRRPARGR